MDIHRCRFIDYQPSPINALAFSHPIPRTPRTSRIPSTLRLAIGRANGTIEIWNPQSNWLHESTLHSPTSSIEGLVWIRSEDASVKTGEVNRLFSIGGGSTKVTEWDLVTGKPLNAFDCNKGVIWSIAAQPRKSHFAAPNTEKKVDGGVEEKEGEDEGEGGEQLVVGCSDGSLVLISTEGGRGSMQFMRVLSHSKKARVLSLTYQNPHTIVVGMSDSRMRVFDTRSNRIISTMGVGQDRQKDVLLWSVKWLPGQSPAGGGYIVAGDSRGEVTLWDGKRYTMLQRIKAHEADVLAVETNGNGNRIVSTGLDRKTVVFDVVGKKNARKLVQVSGRRFHKYDVRAMASFESGNMSVVVSGGIDASPVVIPLQTWGKEFHRTLPFIPQTPIISTVPSARLLVARFDREIKIWHIEDMDKPASIEPDDEEFFGEGRNRTLVGKIVPDIQENIVSSAISASGELLAISTLSCIKVFHLRRRKTQRNILRISKIEADEKITSMGARALQFSPDGKWLSCVDAKSQVYQVKITRDTSSPFTLGDIQKLKRKDKDYTLGSDKRLAPRDGAVGCGRGYERQIRRVTFSPDGSIFAASDLGGWIDCWKCNDEGNWTLIKPYLPRLRGPALAIGFRPALYPTAISSNSPMRLAVENGISEYETLPSPEADKHASLQLLHQQHEQLVLEKQKRVKTLQPSSKLFVVTSHHELYEFDVNEGRLTEWSKRNPPDNLPERFRQIIDRCTGMTFTNDVKKETQRCWLWGSSWIWMFDICHDIPVTGSKEGQQGSATRPAKRKRDGAMRAVADVFTTEQNGAEKTAGAGRRINDREEQIREFVGMKEINRRKNKKSTTTEADEDDINSDEENFLVDPSTKKKNKSAAAITRHERLLLNGKDNADSDSSDSDSSSSDDDDDSSSASASSSSDDDSSSSSSNDDESEEEEQPVISKKKEGEDDTMQLDDDPQTAITTTVTDTDNTTTTRRTYGGTSMWHTHKYRPLMAFSPIGDSKSGGSGRLEMVVVERPQWDVQLLAPKFQEKRDVVR